MAVIEQVSKKKRIEPKVLIEAIEQAILTAAKRQFGAEKELEATFNEETGAVDLQLYMTVVDEVDDEDTEISLEDARRHGLDDPDSPLTSG
ncbi:MAG: N utilization substance protein A, partial [Polyangiales bacterium]